MVGDIVNGLWKNLEEFKTRFEFNDVVDVFISEKKTDNGNVSIKGSVSPSEKLKVEMELQGISSYGTRMENDPVLSEGFWIKNLINNYADELEEKYGHLVK